MISFFIPGKPEPKGRGRPVQISGIVRVLTPAKTRSYENLVKQVAYENMAGTPPLECPVRVCVDVFIPIPESMSKRNRDHALAGRLLPCKKPDLDNCIKAVLDGMNQVVFVDDKQICDQRGSKRYSQTPGVFVSVEPI